jgi:DNA-binding NarL/FixJ family response regulator
MKGQRKSCTVPQKKRQDVAIPFCGDPQLLSGQLLTARESQVLELLFRRLTNKEIAGDLKISERTAKFHVAMC